MAIQGFKEKMPPQDLWRSAYPWRDRPGGSTLWRLSATLQGLSYEKMAHQIALGMRPPRTWENAEFRGTIIGGLRALQVAGVPGFRQDQIGNLEDLKTAAETNRPTNRALDAQLLQLTGSPSLKEGAEKVRQTVIQHGLERPAWGYRSLVVIRPATGAAAQGRVLVHTVGGTVLAATGGGAPWAVIPALVVAKEGALGKAISVDVARWQGYAQEAGTQAQMEQERREIVIRSAAERGKGPDKTVNYLLVGFGVAALALVLAPRRDR